MQHDLRLNYVRTLVMIFLHLKCSSLVLILSSVSCKKYVYYTSLPKIFFCPPPAFLSFQYLGIYRLACARRRVCSSSVGNLKIQIKYNFSPQCSNEVLKILKQSYLYFKVICFIFYQQLYKNILISDIDEFCWQ